MYTDNLLKLAGHYKVNLDWLETGEGEKSLSEPAPNQDLFQGLADLKRQVQEQGDQIDRLFTLLLEDPRWPKVEERLNFLSGRLQRIAIRAEDEDVPGDSPQWSPIGLKPEVPEP